MASLLAGIGDMIVVEDVHKHFGGFRAVDGATLRIEEGSITGLIGPNGAGKTTLVKAVLGLIAPTAGTVWQRPGLRVGYMPQRLRLDPVLPLTVARLLTLTVRRSRRRIAAALAETPPERSVVFEDTPKGVEAAKAGGMRAVGVLTTHPEGGLESSDARVLRLDELPLDGVRP